MQVKSEKPGRYVIVCCCLAVFLFKSEAQSTLQYSGYTKDLLSVVQVRDTETSWDNLIHNRAMFKWQIDTAWILRADVRSRIFFGDQVQHQMFGERIDQAANDVLDLSIGTPAGDHVYLHSYLDRLYVEYEKRKLFIRAGRQRINWGINTLWNPNDIFNAYAFTDFDYEERPGSDAISIRYYTGDLSSIEFAGKIGNDTRDGALAARWRSHLGTYDLQIIGGYLTESRNVVAGGGWAGNLKNWGFKGEGSVFIPVEEEENIGASVSMGWDYVFRSGVLVGFGGLYNALGKTSGGLEELFAFELSARNLYPFRWTINASTGFSIHPLVSTSLTAVYSFATSNPVFVSPAITWSVSQNMDLDLVAQIVLQESGMKYGSPVQAGFLRVKWSY